MTQSIRGIPDGSRLEIGLFGGWLATYSYCAAPLLGQKICEQLPSIPDSHL
jgi:hypothetical protein